VAASTAKSAPMFFGAGETKLKKWRV